MALRFSQSVMQSQKPDPGTVHLIFRLVHLRSDDPEGERTAAFLRIATRPTLTQTDEIVPDFFINIVPDKANSTSSFEDPGIGLTKVAFINYLGRLQVSLRVRH